MADRQIEEFLPFVSKEKIDRIWNPAEQLYFEGILGEKEIKELLFVGRLSDQKGLERLIKAMAQLPGNVKLHIIRRGTRKSLKLEKIVLRISQAERIVFPGTRESAQIAHLMEIAIFLFYPVIMKIAR